jgi:hypothetical protein
LKESDLPQSEPTRQQAVDQLLSELPTMDRKGLVRLWRNLFDREPSPALRRETLIPILAFRIQVKRAYTHLMTILRMHEFKF